MKESAKQLLLYHDLIASIIAAMEARDEYTSCHSMRVAQITERLCGFLDVSEEEKILYHIAAHLHDLGKIGIEDSVLCKEGSLNEQEWLEMKKHPITGFNILKKIDSFNLISKIVRSHHERWDGYGYPDRLSGEDIPFGARIIAVADSIDAMLSNRTYRNGMSSLKCKEEVKKNINIMYDKNVATVALEHWTEILECRLDVGCLFDRVE